MEARQLYPSAPHCGVLTTTGTDRGRSSGPRESPSREPAGAKTRQCTRLSSAPYPRPARTPWRGDVKAMSRYRTYLAPLRDWYVSSLQCDVQCREDGGRVQPRSNEGRNAAMAAPRSPHPSVKFLRPRCEIERNARSSRSPASQAVSRVALHRESMSSAAAATATATASWLSVLRRELKANGFDLLHPLRRAESPLARWAGCRSPPPRPVGLYNAQVLPAHQIGASVAGDDALCLLVGALPRCYRLAALTSRQGTRAACGRRFCGRSASWR